VNLNDREWMNRQCTMQSLATFQQPIRLTGSAAAIPTTFVLANGWNDSPFPLHCERAKQKGWQILSIPCGHDVMLDRPEELTRILLQVAGVH
jgi:hypothetical protein